MCICNKKMIFNFLEYYITDYDKYLGKYINNFKYYHFERNFHFI
jgi:hypothetical protein